MNQFNSYLMENLEEVIRLEIKTDPKAVRKQAQWCGIKPGIRVLDAGCGPGKTTTILFEMIQSGGDIVGVDYSEERIRYAKKHYGQQSGLDFRVHDLRKPLEHIGMFDLIWVRFVLEYNRAESPTIIRNLTACLKPGGHLCLLDLDHNCMNHYELPTGMEQILLKVIGFLEDKYNFDPYAGRKLYAYLYDMEYEDIHVEIAAHHLIYGKVNERDLFNWIKKMEVVSQKADYLFKDYPGGLKGFFADFKTFFLDPRRLVYTPMILCKGKKPSLSQIKR